MPALFEFSHRFSITASADGSWQFDDNLSPGTARTISGKEPSLQKRTGRLAALRMLMPPCLPHAPLPVRNVPLAATDAHFWQFPAITERQAFERHLQLPLPDWRAAVDQRVSAYLGLPWATYIDKKVVPDDVRLVFRVRLRGYRELTAEWDLVWGEDVAIHTVCQHIYWERLLPLWAELGITDLHLSHCEPASAARAAPYGIRVHSWPLAAPNVVNADRRQGLVIGRPLNERRLLASFIGAHMPHYRSDVRLRLREEMATAHADDLVYELRDDWHFNPIVYGAQVAGQVLDAEAREQERAATLRYNQVLSDSVFALCPEGAGPNTLRLWEALAVGAIPVVIVEDWVWPQEPDGAPAWHSAVIPVQRNEIAGLAGRLRRLREFEPGRLAIMQKAGMALYERISQSPCF